MVLDAFEAALGPTGPNPLHHRIDHAIQVTDEQLARMVAMDLATVIHLDGAAADWVLDGGGPDDRADTSTRTRAGSTRWRDFVDAGLHVAAASDTPWLFPDFALTDDIGRPVDQIACGMDGRGRANPETPTWVLDQLLTAEQGLRAVTLDAAYALRRRGQPRPPGARHPRRHHDPERRRHRRHARRDPGHEGGRHDRRRDPRLLRRPGDLFAGRALSPPHGSMALNEVATLNTSASAIAPNSRDLGRSSASRPVRGRPRRPVRHRAREAGWPMTTSRRRFGSLSAAMVALALVTGCSPSSTITPPSSTSSASGSPAPSAAASSPRPGPGASSSSAGS